MIKSSPIQTRALVMILLMSQMLAAAGACADNASKMFNGLYAIPNEFVRECDYPWKTFQKFPGKDRARLKWMEMWSVLPDSPTASDTLKRMVQKAGFVKSTMKLEITDHRVFAGASTTFTNANRKLLVIELFGVGERLYIMIGGN
jgi:hypothetical protein